ncbi:MAG: DNA-binding GntR family transcriptional regulator [Cellvibrionaceae bacterium]|jgi:DNA-binding GntR family transcriptional regulator
MPIPTTHAIERTFIRDDVYHSLKYWVVNGDLAPGEKLKDKELAAQLGVSRTPVREALRKLEDEGLVVTSANRWTRVAEVSLEDADRIYPIILSLESLALKLAFPKLLNSHLEKMRKINQDFQQLLEGGEPHAIVSLDTEFHTIFIDAADNKELESILMNLKTKYQRIELAYFRLTQLSIKSVYEHRQIVDALENKDLDLALMALTQNWEASIAHLNSFKMGRS